MPTIYPIDSYQEKEIGVWLNNKPLYQMDIKINTVLSESPVFFDTENIFNQLDYLTNIEGISFSSELNKYITYSDKTYEATLSYDRETHYIKLDFIEDLGTLSNTTITFYYTKTSTNRLRTSTILEQSRDYYPVMDVKVNGDSVIDGSRVAQIKSYKEVTQEEYNALPDSKKYDGIMYCIIDSTTPEDKQVIDIQLDGVSVVDKYGVANLQGLATAVDLAKKQNLLVAGNNVTLVPLSDGTVQINASGGGGSVSGVTDVIVNGSSVVTNNVAVFTVPTSVPTKTSDLLNDSGYINKEVNNLTNYYTKAQTNNKIEEEINSIPIVTNQDKGLMSPALKSLAENSVQDVKVNNVSVVDEYGVANITGGGGEEYLSNLSDVELTNLQNRQGLLYDSILQKWVNAVVGGSGNVDDVVMNGQSIVDANKIASFNNYVELTQAQYDALPASKLTDGVLYCIKDTGIVEGDKYAPIIYSLEEREIGTWTDGKPLYEKTKIFTISDLDITSGELSSSRIAGEFHLTEFDSLNYDDLWIETGFISDKKPTGTSGIICSPSAYPSSGTYIRANIQKKSYTFIYFYLTYSASKYYQDRNNLRFVFNLRYTKTTDVPGSGTWGTDGVPMVHYDGNEKIIGTWFGETLYEKTVNFGTFPNATSKSVAHNISNLKFCVDLIASGSDSNGNMLVLPRVVSDSSVLSAQTSCYITQSSVVIEAGTNRSSYSGYVTIRYTKSS